MMRSSFWKTSSAARNTGNRFIQATMNSAGEISFTILSMTLSLAAVFIPLVFHAGIARPNFPRVRDHDHRRDFRFGFDFADAYAVDVRAHPARARAADTARHGWSVSSTASSSRFARFTAARSLVSRPRLAGAAPILIACCVRRLVFLHALPFTLCRPATAASSAGAFMVQEGASPAAAAPASGQLDPILQANPAVDKYFTVAGRAGPGRRRFHRACS